MDLEYFRDKICDELCGAKDYAKRAIEIKAMNSSWGKMLLEMSAAELSHATNLYRMFEEYYQIIQKHYTVVPEYVDDIRDEIVETYTEEYTKVKTIHDMYSS